MYILMVMIVVIGRLILVNEPFQQTWRRLRPAWLYYSNDVLAILVSIGNLNLAIFGKIRQKSPIHFLVWTDDTITDLLRFVV